MDYLKRERGAQKRRAHPFFPPSWLSRFLSRVSRTSIFSLSPKRRASTQDKNVTVLIIVGDDYIIIIQFKRFCFSPQRQKLSVLKALAINQGRVRLTILRTTNKWNKCLKWLVLVLLHLFWNGCWSLQSDRLSAVCMISSWITVFFFGSLTVSGKREIFCSIKIVSILRPQVNRFRLS